MMTFPFVRLIWTCAVIHTGVSARRGCSQSKVQKDGGNPKDGGKKNNKNKAAQKEARLGEVTATGSSFSWGEVTEIIYNQGHFFIFF